jgi:hypothetical protein
MSKNLPLTTFIQNRCRQLGLRKIDLIRRTSYRNHAKGLRRLDALLAGNLDDAQELLRSLPEALDIRPDEFHRVVQETRDALELERREAAAVAEAEWRAAFVPHAVILVERDIPQPIFVAAFIGTKRLLHIEFDNKESSTFLDQALEQAKTRPGMFWDSTEVLPAFGKVVGVVINYTPEYAVYHDLEGNVLASRPRAHRIGEATLWIGKRAVPWEQLGGCQKPA